MSVTEFKNCLVSIENGIIHSVIVDNVRPIDYFGINPKENSGIEYYKLPTKKGLIPIGLNYKLQYENKSGDTNTILLHLNKWELFKIKRQKKELLIQDKNLHLNLLKTSIVSLFSLASFYAGVIYEKHNDRNTETNTKTQTNSMTINAKNKNKVDVIKPKIISSKDSSLLETMSK
ncbi:hypothetical protein C8N41_103388 [Winogradskyella sediminis]|nr:hypothetical protein C8N41_103388 [Winogradskyella sediminis]